MIEIVCLPFHTVFHGMKSFPLSHNMAHVFVWRKRKQRVQMIWHQQEKGDMPKLTRLIKPHGLEQCGAQSGVCQRSRIIDSTTNANMKNSSRLDPGRNFVMEFSAEVLVMLVHRGDCSS